MALSSSSVAQPDARSKFWLVLRLSRLEYLSFNLLSFAVGYLSTSRFQWSAFLAGSIACLLLLLTCVLINLYTDQVEDRINQPERVKMAEMVGYETIRNIALGSLVSSILWALVIGYVSNVRAVAIYLFAIFVNVSYSWGLRLKQHFLFKSLVLASASPLGFAVGWVMNEPLHTFPLVVLLLSYRSAVGIGVIQDIADVVGDRVAGLKTVFNSSRGIATITHFVWFSPYVLLVLLVLLRIFEPKYLITLIFLPLAIYGDWQTLRAQSIADKEKVYRYSLLYGMLFSSLVFFTLTPTVPVLGLIVALMAYTYLVSYLMDRAQFSLLGFYAR